MHLFSHKVGDTEYYINHNGDYSGNILITSENTKVNHQALELPAELFFAFTAEYIRSKRISELQDATYQDILAR